MKNTDCVPEMTDIESIKILISYCKKEYSQEDSNDNLLVEKYTNDIWPNYLIQLKKRIAEKQKNDPEKKKSEIPLVVKYEPEEMQLEESDQTQSDESDHTQLEEFKSEQTPLKKTYQTLESYFNLEQITVERFISMSSTEREENLDLIHLLNQIAEYLKLITPSTKKINTKKLFTNKDFILKKEYCKAFEKIPTLYRKTLSLLDQELIPPEHGKNIILVINKIFYNHGMVIKDSEREELIKAIKSKAGNHTKPDLYLALPTAAMTLHPGFKRHSEDQHSENYHNLYGDSGLRPIAALKGVDEFVSMTGNVLNIGFLQEPKVEPKKTKEDKSGSEHSLSMASMSKIAKNLDIPYLSLGDENDIVMNQYTLDAVGQCEIYSAQMSSYALKERTHSIGIFRPPGHHTDSDDSAKLSDTSKAKGFCFTNNMYIGLKQAAIEGASHLVAVDLDLHDGDGTKSALTTWSSDCRVDFFNSFDINIWPHSGKPPSLPITPSSVNLNDFPISKAMQITDDKLLNALKTFLIKTKKSTQDKDEKNMPNAVFISFGLDAHKDDPAAGDSARVLFLETDFYRKALECIFEELPNIPVCIYLEGGYNLKVIQEVFKNTLLCFDAQKKHKPAKELATQQKQEADTTTVRKEETTLQQPKISNNRFTLLSTSQKLASTTSTEKTSKNKKPEGPPH